MTPNPRSAAPRNAPQLYASQRNATHDLEASDMPALLARTHDAFKVERLHSALAVRRPSGLVKEEPCVGHDVAALQMAVASLMNRSRDDLSPEARTILATIAPLGFRCKTLWSQQ